MISSPCFVLNVTFVILSLLFGGSGVGSGVVLVRLTALELAVALWSFLLPCHLPVVSLAVMALLVCCDSLLVLWPLVSWPVLVLSMP